MVANQILRNEGRQMETFETKQQSNICFQYFICMYYLFPSQNKRVQWRCSPKSHKKSQIDLQMYDPKTKNITLISDTAKKKSIKAPEQHLIGHTTKCKYDVLGHILQSNKTEMYLKTVFPLLWPQK